jgi:hypothetical protein
MSRLTSWVGLATRDPGTAGPTRPTTRDDAYGRELVAMLELVRSGRAFKERATAERLSFRLVGVLTRAYEDHEVDEHGRCLICRPRMWWPWPRRAAGTVRAAFAYHMPRSATPDLGRAWWLS